MLLKTFFFICVLFAQGALYCDAEAPYYWKEDYQKTLSSAKESNKAVILAFLGTGWCPWSEKLQTEVLMNENFLDGLKEDAQFVRLDFPEHSKHTIQQKIAAGLKEKFQVTEFPTLILLDSEENEIIKLGFMPMQAEEFSAYIKKMLNDWNGVKQVVNKSSLAKMSEEELEKLYLKSKGCGFNKFKEEILKQGLSSSKGPFFIMEKYATLIECGKKIKNPEMEALRKEIVKRDPQNKNGTQLKMAILDFEILAGNTREQKNPKVAIKPLVEYVNKFGKQDKENLWRVEMMMAQYLFSKKVIDNAVVHAQASYEVAPENVKTEILETITYLKNQ